MEFFLSMSLPQWGATLVSIIYILFAVKNKPIAFVFGLIASAFWAYEGYFNLNLKFDAFLQLFYVAMSIYGLYAWKAGTSSNEELQISRLSPNGQWKIILSGIAISVIFGWIGKHFFATNLPYLDALTTGFSIIATFLLARRYIDNWIYWMVINPLYMFIYWKSGAYLFIGIMLLYTGMAVLGYNNWKSILLKQK